jgi:hypothetical protein
MEVTNCDGSEDYVRCVCAFVNSSLNLEQAFRFRESFLRDRALHKKSEAEWRGAQ